MPYYVLSTLIKRFLRSKNVFWNVYWNKKSQINATMFLSATDAGISVKSSIIDCKVREFFSVKITETFEPLES